MVVSEGEDEGEDEIVCDKEEFLEVAGEEEEFEGTEKDCEEEVEKGDFGTLEGESELLV